MTGAAVARRASTSSLRTCYVSAELTENFKAVCAENVADFCLEMYRRMGLLEAVRVARSSDPDFRRCALPVDDYFVDVPHDGEIVRARRRGDKLLLHKGADCFVELPWQEPEKEQISPTRDTRLRWMQSVIRCTHYVAGAGEMQYLNRADAPEIDYVERDTISESDKAYIGDDDNR